ncbi:Crp/Fnr family transcriptional regulator [Aquimarina sp. 2201CG1-2-11]|uniref:Crp/Fnr family transcriptional regulator n=1 Tax=Aquimarina discodermiae TaxID=3231043 RepID=UPI0034633ECC
MKTQLLNTLVEKGLYKCSNYTLNETILKCKCYSDSIYLIKEGIVKILQITDEGEEIVPVLLTKGQVFGNDAIYGEFYTTYESESVHQNTIIYEFSITDIRAIVKNNMTLHKDLLLLLKEEHHQAERRIQNLRTRSAEDRLILTFIEFFNKFKDPSSTEDEVYIKSPLTQNELAGYIRTSRVTTNQILNILKSKSLIEYSNKDIVLKKGFFTYYKETSSRYMV